MNFGQLRQRYLVAECEGTLSGHVCDPTFERCATLSQLTSLAKGHQRVLSIGTHSARCPGGTAE